MRIRDGFSLAEIPGLPDLLAPSASNAPVSPRDWFAADRRFVSLDEPGRSGPDSLVVVAAGARRAHLEALAASRPVLVLAEEGVSGLPEDIPVIRVRDARVVLALLARALEPRCERPRPFAAGAGNIVHPSAVVEGVLAGDVIVEAGAVVATGAFIGRGARIEANAVIRGHVVIGANTVVQPGAVVGTTGFGFHAGARGPETMPHAAGVVIGADCLIGANTVVAAGVLHPTELGDGCKLDSHVQIAHNVRVGPGAMMASQSGVAGSTVIGARFRMGGAASVAGHLRIGDDVSVAAKAGVTKDVPDGVTVAGFPARPIHEWRRTQAAQARLGKMKPET